MEVSQASLAVANAASILSDHESGDSKVFPAGMTGQELNELQQSKLALSSLQEEVESLRSQNSSLRAELVSQVRLTMFDLVKVTDNINLSHKKASTSGNH